MRSLVWIGGAVLMAASLAAQAQRFDIKNGLWESTFTHEMSGMQSLMEDELKKMPPEKQAKMRELLAKQQGSRTMTHKTCVTEKDRERLFNPERDSSQTCKTTVVSQTSKRIETKIVCSNEKMSSTGMMIAEAVSSENTRGSFEMKSTTESRPFTVKGTFTSRWLSADCGDVKSSSEIREQMKKK
jgi:hypothetical protein